MTTLANDKAEKSMGEEEVLFSIPVWHWPGFKKTLGCQVSGKRCSGQHNQGSDVRNRGEIWLLTKVKTVPETSLISHSESL